jgi:hypothetical protein
METKAISHLMREPTNQQFWLGVAPSNAAHALTALLRSKRVHFGTIYADYCSVYRHAPRSIEEWKIDYNLNRPHLAKIAAGFRDGKLDWECPNCRA